MSAPPLPARARRLFSGGLGAAGIVALLLGARPDVPLAESFSVARKFWRADYRSRNMNAPFLRDDPEFAAGVLTADARWPLDVDIVLVLPPRVPAGEAEERRRSAGLLLAPRRVVLERAELGDLRFRISARPRGTP